MAAEERRDRIGKLAEWLKHQIDDRKSDISKQIDNGVLAEPYQGTTPAPEIDGEFCEHLLRSVAAEAEKRWLVSSSTAKNYAEMAYNTVEGHLLARAKAVGKRYRESRPDFGILLGRPLGDRSSLSKAVDEFKKLEGPTGQPVERGAFLQALVRTGMTPDDANATIRKLFREGLIYESKPGFFRRISA